MDTGTDTSDQVQLHLMGTGITTRKLQGMQTGHDSGVSGAHG